MVWGKAGSTTTTSTGDTITVSRMTASESNVIMLHKINSGNVNPLLTFNSDSGSNYAWRYNNNGGTDATVVNGTKLEMAVTGATPTLFNIFYSVNVSTEEKLLIGHTVEQNTAGAGTVPQRMEVVSKWTNTSDQITTVSFGNDAAGDYAIDSNVSVIGSDITPADAIPFPTNVQAGSRAEITDTRKMYNYVVPSITLEDDFSSDNWTDSDSTNIGVSGGALNWSMFRNMSNDASSRDLGSVASDKWVLRFKVTQGSSIGSVGAGNGFHFGISDSDNSVAQNASQDFVGMAYYYDNQSSYKAQDSDGAIVPEIYSGDSSQNFTITANDVFYFEIIKNGSSYTVEGFTNSDYSTGSLGKITGTTTATGLRYLKIMNTLPAQGAIPTSTNPFNGTIDDVKFYDGFTQTTRFWQEIGA